MVVCCWMPKPISTVEEQREREDQVHEGAREHHDDALPRLARVEQAVLVAGLELLVGGRAGVLDHAAPGGGGAGLDPAVRARREHADHADVAAERDRLDAVLGLALLARPDGRAEADHVLRHADAEELGGGQVAQLVPRDREQQADHEDDYAEDEHQGRHARASAVVRSMGSPVGGQFTGPGARPGLRFEDVRHGQGSSRRGGAVLLDDPRDGLHDPVERQRAVQERLHALLVGRIEHRRGRARELPHVPGEARPTGTPRCRAGRTPRSTPCSSRRRAPRRGRARGQPRPMAMGPRMSGGVAWAIVDPSVNSTIEWTYDWGCTTTSMRSKGMS